TSNEFFRPLSLSARDCNLCECRHKRTNALWFPRTKSIFECFIIEHTLQEFGIPEDTGKLDGNTCFQNTQCRRFGIVGHRIGHEIASVFIVPCRYERARKAKREVWDAPRNATLACNERRPFATGTSNIETAK